MGNVFTNETDGKGVYNEYQRRFFLYDAICNGTKNTPKELLSDKEFVLSLAKFSKVIMYSDEISQHLLSDREMVFALSKKVRFDSLERIGENLLEDKSVMMAIASNNKYLSLKGMSSALLNDKKFILELVRVNLNLFSDLPSKYRDDEDVVRVIVESSGYRISYFIYASTRLKNDKEFIKSVLASDTKVLKYASESVRDDRDVIQTAVSFHPSAFEHASERLKDDYELVSFVMRKDSNMLRYASDRMKRTRAFLQLFLRDASLGNLKLMFPFIPNDMIHEMKPVIQEQIAEDPCIVFGLPDELFHDPDIIETAIKANSDLSEYLSPIRFENITTTMRNGNKRELRKRS
jgi:hypothetical protein